MQDYQHVQIDPALRTGDRRWRRALKKVLNVWIQIQGEYSRRVQNDLPYYTERTAVGMLAAAAWRCGVPALEEFAVDKKDNVGDHKGGRGDLFLRLGGEDIYVEAKRSRPPLGLRGSLEHEFRYVEAAIDRARGDAKKTLQGRWGVQHVGAVFVLPRIRSRWHEDRAEVRERIIDELGPWLETQRRVDFSAAWFPKRFTKEWKQSWGPCFPGIAVLGLTRRFKAK